MTRDEAIQHADKVAEEQKQESLKRLEAMRAIAIEDAKKKEEQEAIKKREQEEAKKYETIRKRNLYLHEYGMKDLIPFYLKDESHHSRDWWVFELPGYLPLYVSINKKNPHTDIVQVRFYDNRDDAVGKLRWSNIYYDLASALIDAKIESV